MPTMQVYLRDDIYFILKKYANQHDKTTSRIVKWAVMEYLKKRGLIGTQKTLRS